MFLQHMPRLRFQAMLFGLLFATCFSAGASFAEPLKVAVSIEPQAWLVEQIGGSLVGVEVLVPAGSDLHTYEPKPSQVTAISRAELYLSIGVDFERAWLPRLTSASPSMKVVEMDKGIQKIAMAMHEKGHGHEQDLEGHTDGRSHGVYDDKEKMQAEGRQWMGRDGTPDPHVWTEPANMLIMAKNTFEALQQADRKNAETYVKNYFKTRKTIEKTELKLMKMFGAVHGSGRTFLVFHPSWGYFARAHALTQVPIEVQGKEPSPRELAGIIKQAKEMGATAIFVQPQRSRKAADMVAGEIGARVVEADPMAYDWPTNLLNVAQQFKDALH